MGTFHMEGQHVHGDQTINSARNDININQDQRSVLIGELAQLKAGIKQADLEAEVTTKAQNEIDAAIAQASQPQPTKQTILERIEGAKKLIEAAGAATGLVTGFVAAAETVQKFLPS